MSIAIPFRLRGLDGLVTVYQEANEDPRRWGYHLINLPYDLSVVEGFPVVRAEILYPGEGAMAGMGWIQVIRYGGGEAGEQIVQVDRALQHWDADTPYYSFGIRPEFFDAPFIEHQDVSWLADTFLVTGTDLFQSREVQPICGFRWGYSTHSKPPDIVPAETIGLPEWEKASEVLKESYQRWEFLREWAS